MVPGILFLEKEGQNKENNKDHLISLLKKANVQDQINSESKKILIYRQVHFLFVFSQDWSKEWRFTVDTGISFLDQCQSKTTNGRGTSQCWLPDLFRVFILLRKYHIPLYSLEPSWPRNRTSIAFFWDNSRDSQQSGRERGLKCAKCPVAEISEHISLVLEAFPWNLGHGSKFGSRTVFHMGATGQ